MDPKYLGSSEKNISYEIQLYLILQIIWVSNGLHLHAVRAFGGFNFFVSDSVQAHPFSPSLHAPHLTTGLSKIQTSPQHRQRNINFAPSVTGLTEPRFVHPGRPPLPTASSLYSPPSARVASSEMATTQEQSANGLR